MDAERVDGAGRAEREEELGSRRSTDVGTLKGPSDAGQGGKRGHSNMEHWEFSEEIKAAARKRRRLQAKAEIAHELAEHRNRKSLGPKAEKDTAAPDDTNKLTIESYNEFPK